MLKDYVANSAYIGKNVQINIPVAIGKDTEIHNNCSLGAYSLLNNNSIMYSNTQIGRYCSIARFCEIGVASHPTTFLSSSSFQYNHILFKHPDNSFKRKISYIGQPETYIGNDVWIGAKSIIQSGVKVGHGAVIGALSYVNQDIPPYAIAVGIPAKIIKYRFNQEQIQQLLELKWWELNPIDMKDVQFDNIDLAIEQLQKIKGNL